MHTHMHALFFQGSAHMNTHMNTHMHTLFFQGSAHSGGKPEAASQATN